MSTGSSSSTIPQADGNPPPAGAQAPFAADAIDQFILEKFEVIATPLQLRDPISNIIVATPNRAAFPRNPVNLCRDVFLGVNALTIFQHIADKTTEEMQRKVRTNEVNGPNAQRYFKQLVTADEVLVILGLQFIFFQRRGAHSIEEQFARVPENRQKFPMSKKRYSAIIGCLTADFEKLGDLLRTSWKNAINPGTEFAVDETMYAFFGRELDCPKRYIPRKPHKNGLLTYPAAFNTAHGPYLFDVAVDWIFNRPLNGRAAFRDIVKRWNWESPFHVIVDAGFSGEQEHLLLGDLACNFTASINQGHKKWLVELLKRYCAREEHIAVVDADGMVWSFAKDTLDDAEHFVVSNAFKKSAKRAREDHINPEQLKHLAKVGIRGLNMIADQFGLASHLNEFVQATNIAQAINQLVPEADIEPGDVIQGNNGNGGGQPAPQGDDLEKKTAKELQEIARGLQLKAAGQTKQDLVIRIRQARTISSSQRNSTKEALEQGRKKEGRALHQKYKQVFNSIDQHDSKWYDVQNHHDIHNWRAKFVMSLMISGVVNASVVFRHFEELSLKHFCYQLGDALVWD